jgi:hypothetical protein
MEESSGTVCEFLLRPLGGYLAVQAQQYVAHFHAQWGPFTSSYQVPITARPIRGGLRFDGEQDLGALQGGVYKYRGVVTAAQLTAEYDSRYDRGTFTLKRPVRNSR